MSTSTIRIITGLVLIVHGIGHVMAFFPALNISSTDKWHYRSWLLTGLLGDTVSRVLVIVLFGAAMIGFIAAGLGLFGWLVPHSAWQTLAIVSAVISLVALALFWNSFVAFFPNKIGAIVVNIATLWALLGSGSFSETIQNL
ncbi:MAG: hypothetical protein PVF74_02560 [Anaerolineales bacterium]|jgi:hypothetical protein